MEITIKLQITLQEPTAGVDFGLQKGSGNNYDVVSKQRSEGNDLLFQFEIVIKGDRDKDALPKLSGPFVQGPAGGKFIYINIGTSAGQMDSVWSRRLKIPLSNITWAVADELLANPAAFLTTHVPGTGKDGSPNCATVKPFKGWAVSA
jgi:hypothetical protein